MNVRITCENQDSATGGISVSAAQNGVRGKGGGRTIIIQLRFIQTYNRWQFWQNRETSFQFIFLRGKPVHIGMANGEAKRIEGQ
jgi:hypothetical protein